MYLMYVGEVVMRTLAICVPVSSWPSPSFPTYDQRMPAGNRKLVVAKQKRQEGRDQGHAAFAVHAARPPSPNGSHYCIVDDGTSESATDVDSSDEKEKEKEAKTSVVALQRLYGVFLPRQLQLDDDTREKRRKTKNRPPVYTKESRTTGWRRSVAQKKAAQGCATLDGFIERKVRKPEDPRSEAPHCQ